MLSFTIGAQSITVFIDGKINTIDNSHANFEPLLAELRRAPAERSLDSIRDFITVKKMIERFTNGRVTITEVEVIFDGSPIADYLAGRMMAVLDQGIDVEPYANFMANVAENPNSAIRHELFQWLEKGEMPITPDGCFIAFKKVRDDYTDCHTGTFDHSVGTLLEMDRAACDPNRRNHCSTGFHFCSPGYLKSFGGERVMVVKVNPADVTSIPDDYSYTKGRTFRYEVIAELSEESAAHHDVWRAAVVADDPAEYPADILAVLMPLDTPVEANCAAIEAGMSDAFVAATETPIADLTDAQINGSVDLAHYLGQPVFTTTDGREFSASVILAALEDASVRGAAKNLGINESTLRGWKAKL